jgi:hypothetical protein
MGEEALNRQSVTCPTCELEFLSARALTYCPACHNLVEPRMVTMPAPDRLLTEPLQLTAETREAVAA